MSDSHTYILIDTHMVTDDMVNQSMSHSDVARYSLDGTSCILKFNTKFPNTMAGYAKFTLEEITNYLEDNSADWIEAKL